MKASLLINRKRGELKLALEQFQNTVVLRSGFDKPTARRFIIGQRKTLGDLFANIGFIHRSLNNNKEALEYFKKATQFFVGGIDPPVDLENEIALLEKSFGETSPRDNSGFDNLKLTLNKVKEPVFNETKEEIVLVGNEEAMLSVFLPLDANISEDEILAKSFKQFFKPNEYFRVIVENNSSKQMSFYVNNASPNKTCQSVSSDGDGIAALIPRETFKSQVYLTTGNGGDENFVILASRNSYYLRRHFESDEFVTGNPRGNSIAAGKVLETIDDIELQQSVPKGKQISSEKIAITLGNVYSRSGQPLMSAKLYDGLLQIGNCLSKNIDPSKEESYKKLIISWHNNRALANYLTGDLGKSKSDYETSLTLLEKLRQENRKKYLSEEAIILTNLAQVYATLGNQQEAIKRYEKSLQILNKAKDESVKVTRNRKAVVYNGLGTSNEFLGEFEKAEKFYRLALGIQKAARQKASEGITLNSLARLAMSKRDFKKAEFLFNQSLNLSLKTGNKSGVASAYNNLGLLYTKQSKLEEAKELFVKAEVILRQLGNRTALPNIMSNLMSVEQQQNHGQTAIFFGKQAVNTLQEIRSEISNIEKDLQRSFILSREQTYRTLADILVSKGRFAEAQNVLALLKEEEYFGYVRRDASEIKNLQSRAELNADERKLIERYNLFAERVAGIGAEFQKLDDKLKKLNGALLPLDEQKRYEELTAQLDDANGAFRIFLREELTKELGKPAAKEILVDRALQSKLKEWGSGTVALYTVVGEDRYRVILTTPTTQTDGKTEFNVEGLKSAADLNKKIFAFRDALQNPLVDPRPLGKELYDILIKPIEKDLAAANAKTLVWSLDGTLRYIPFAALSPDGKTYLAEKYQNAVVTSTTRQNLSEKVSADWRLLGAGVTKESRVTEPNGTREITFSALPGVRDELLKIVSSEDAATRETGVMTGKRLFDDEFNLAALKTGMSQRVPDKDDKEKTKPKYNVIHLATHFRLGGDLAKSFLLLGKNQALTLEKVSDDATLNFGGVELVTLSACETGFGTAIENKSAAKEREQQQLAENNGAEVDSLATFIEQRGAHSVMASLWSVADDSTQLLIGEFYRVRQEKPELTKAAAMQAAQQAMIAGKLKSSGANAGCRAELAFNKKDGAPFKCEAGAPYSHPFYWSPFVLIGNWR